MLFHLQFPFTDIRSFVEANVPRVHAPSWPAPIPTEEFVRSFGVIRQRLNGGLSGWIGESEYCDARRAVLFPTGTNGPKSAGEIRLNVAFRRLYFDGYVVGKTEAGLTTISLPPTSMERLVAQVLTVPTSVRTVKGGRQQQRLYEADKPLAQLYTYATSKVVHDLNKAAATPVIFSESPILFIDIGPREIVAIPPYARMLPVDSKYRFRLFFWRTPIQGRSISVWCIIRNDLPFDQDARHLRVYLLRLNAEHQSLKRVLKQIEVEKIAPEPRSATAELLQDYLNIATRRIGKCDNKALSYSSELDILAYSVFDLAESGQRDSLMQRLHLLQVRKNIRDKVDRYSRRQSINVSVYNGGTLDMSNDKIIVGPSGGNVNIKAVLQNVNQSLQNVQQTVSTMPVANDAQKKELHDLVDQLTELLHKVPDQVPDADAAKKAESAQAAEAVAAQVNHLMETAAKEKPNKPLLQVLGDGVKKAAEFLKDVAPSAVAIAGKIVGLIGKIHGFVL
jgi:hypothetical protein